MAAGSLNQASWHLAFSGSDFTFGTPDDSDVSNPTFTFDAEGSRVVITYGTALGIGAYRATIDSTVADLAGNTLRASHTWTFFLAPGGSDGDPDDDGLTNAEEAAAHTNPLLADSDGDGWTDDIELADGTDPLDASKRPKFTVLAMPPVEVALNTPDETLTTNGAQIGYGTAFAAPPVEIVLSTHDEAPTTDGALLGYGTVAAFPPVDVVVNDPDAMPSTDAALLGYGSVFAFPPLVIKLDAADAVPTTDGAAFGYGTSIAFPPIRIQLPAQ